ncbi:unnamed protein product [Orchesella dallaii]|uniref:THO complex subunit 5 n=1 Tax=Orchesella dallaii TaxID=48710 RepID=A0ABP1Q3A6_9HEXA
MDRDRDRDRSSSRQIKRPKTSSSSESTRQHSSSSSSIRDAKVEEKPVVHDDEKPLPVNKKEIFEKITAYEYEEARTMDPAKAVELYHTILEKFEENAAEVFAMKHGHGSNDPQRKLLLRMEGLNYLASLRTINRLLKFRLKIVKDEQQAKRKQVDSEHLLLQNLLYEATNLQNQVAAVQDYKGMDEKIDLIPVDQFYKDAPEKVAKPEVTESNPHRLRIARLEYEFIQRQHLTDECARLEKEKEIIGKKIEDKQVKIDSVRPLLNKVLEATLPLQDFFGLDISAKKIRNDIARHLPSPLYVLFVQSEAYQESAEGKHRFIIRIGGDVEAAKELVVAQEEVEDESDSERNLDADAEISERRILRKRSSIGMSLDDNRKRTFQKHPLWIEWIVKWKGSESLTIQFYYLIKLKIVTVKSRVHRDTTDGTTSTSISGNSDNVLIELFPNDYGQESPNPANNFIFNKFGISSFSTYLKETGKPYVWAQKICGLEFPELGGMSGEGCEVKSKMDVSCRNIEGTLKQIRKRLVSQSKLWSQMKALETRNIQIPSAAKDFFPQKNSTTFVSWEAIDYETYRANKYTKQLIVSEGVSFKDMFYKAVLQRGRAKMTALVSIKMDFPAVAPVFCIQLDMDGELRNGASDGPIRDIEREINVHAPEEFAEWSDVLISLQLHRLMMCCDIILETDFTLGEAVGPSEFIREKLVLRTTVGRNLRRPFQFVNQGGGYFTQRI